MPAREPDSVLEQFHALYRGEFAFVWAAARRLGVPPGAVDDAVQDVFVTAYRRLDQLRFEVSPRAWLYGVTRRVASRYHRGAFRRRRRVAALEQAAPPIQPAPQDRALALQHIDRLLDDLGPGTRAAWEMSELLGMSGPEIASELGLPLNTVYSRVRLARQQLQRSLGDEPLARAVARRRADEQPPERAAQRAWLVLLPTLSRPAGLGLALLASSRTAVATTLLLVGATAVIVTRRAPEPAPARPAVAAITTRNNTTDAAPTAPPVPAASPPTTIPAAPVAPASARPTRSADRLAAEVALLDRAHASLGAGDVDAALALLATHARDFADGALIDLREAARVQALCSAGRPAEAEAAAIVLLAAYPGSAVAQRHRDFVCPPKKSAEPR